MKQIILLITIFFLCNSLTFAQKTISKEDFESLVDYANCKYVESFIEKNDKDKIEYFKTYQQDLAKRLQEASLESLEDVLSYKDLNNQLMNNIPAQLLAKKINERKLRFTFYQDDISLVTSLSTTGWSNIDLSQTAANIQNSILTKLDLAENNSKSSKSFSEAEVVKTQTIQTSTQVEQLQSNLDQLQQQYDNLSNDNRIIEYQKSLENFKIITFSILGFLVILFVIIFFMFKKNLREKIISVVLESQRIREKFPQSEQRPSSLNERQIKDIIKGELLKHQSDSQVITQPTPRKRVVFEDSKPVVKYLKGKSGKIFNRADNNPDNSFFKLFDESGDAALFEFYGDEAEALAKRIFSEDICIIVSGSYQNAESIRTKKPGKIERVGEQWEVKEPIQIELI